MWSSYITAYLKSRLNQLKINIEKIKKENGELRNHPDVRLYVAAVRGMEQVHSDPTNKEYQLGKALGDKHCDWRRIKHLLPARYRLFFKFFSSNNEIYFAWLNDEHRLRTKGAKNDCYAYFKWMLDSGQLSSCRDGLSKISSSR